MQAKGSILRSNQLAGEGFGREREMHVMLGIDSADA